MPLNPYATLGIERGADEESIRKAYRDLVRQWHPDRNKDPDAESKMKEINEAYAQLMDQTDSNFNIDIDPFFFSNSGGFFNISDLLSGHASGSKQVIITRDISISMLNALNGLTINLDGNVLDIPRGVHHGQIFELINKSVKYRIRVLIANTDGFTLINRNDVGSVEFINCFDMLLGNIVSVRTLDGWADLEVPPLTKYGSDLIIPGQGLYKNINSEERGNQYVKVGVDIPDYLSEAQLDLIREARDLGVVDGV